MKKIQLILNLALLLSATFAFSQVGIGTPSPTTTLDVIGVNNGGAVTAKDGVLVPRVNDANMATAAAGTSEGQLVYNTVLNNFYYWSGTSWNTFGQSKPSMRLANTSAITDADLNNVIVCNASPLVFNLNTAGLTPSEGDTLTIMDGMANGQCSFEDDYTGLIEGQLTMLVSGGAITLMWDADSSKWYVISGF